MSSIDINYFDLLSNELIAEVVNSLDLQSLFRLASTCNRLCEFKEISNEQWRRYYAQKWLAEEKELAIYSEHNWQQLYHDRYRSENEYLLWVKGAQSESNQNMTDEERYNAVLDGIKKYRIVPKDNGAHDTYYDPIMDPWAILLQANSQKINPPLAVIKACLNEITGFFSPPFTVKDQEREIMSGRFEIAVTTLAKYVAEDISVLVLPIFQSAFSDDHKNIGRKMPIGLLGLFAKHLDLTIAPETLSAIVNRLWEAAATSLINEDMFVGLGIISKVIDILLKSTNDEQLNKYECFFVLTWFHPSKPENKKILANAPFMHYLIDQLSIVPAEHVRWILQLITAFGEYNGTVINETRLVHHLMDFIRDTYRDNTAVLPYLLNAVSDMCLDENNNSCIKLAESESELEYLLSLVKLADDEDVKKVAQRALNVIDTVVRNEIGAEKLLDMNTLDKLLLLIEDPNNTHLLKNLYYTLKYLVSFGEKLGLGDEIFPKLLEHKDALLERGYGSTSDAIQAACDEFWMTFSCMTTPPRDVSVKLIDRALPLILDEKTKLRMKIDAAVLVANIAEIDIALFENKWMTPLFNSLAEYLIDFDPEKEHAELRKQKKGKEDGPGTLQEAEKKENENSQDDDSSDEEGATTTQTFVGKASDFLAQYNEGEEDGEDENDEEEEDGEDENEDEEVGENESGDDDDEVDEYDVNESPWPLNLIAQIVRFDYVQDVAIQNEKFIDKLFSMLEDELLEFEGHFLAAYVFSLLIHKPGWNSAKALQYIEDFAIECEYDVEWNFIFALLEPYLHLFQKENPEPLVILGSWFLAHMSTLESGRQILKKDLDPKIVSWMKSHPHARVQHNINHFTRNMQKKSRRKQ